ncbi:MAG: insulinase family protein [Verrucomicrobia bacterium]|nr:insulinase family protein [Verrucomicrobiota bacterium]
MKTESSRVIGVMIYLVVIGLILQPQWTPAQEQSLPLPLDPRIDKGQFENGVQYMIRRNSRPENRMELRLVVNTGSIQEDEDQLGLAHFIEHMAFNGTRHFKKNELVDFLESIGLRFGPDLNAYTSFEETVYMLQVPLDDAEVVEKSFLVLQDWAVGIEFDPEELEKERGVIVEEWRLGQGAEKRIQDKQLPLIFHNSRYAERLPIGDMDIVRKAPREVFLRYYHDWYRPDRMSVVAVGDFEPDAIKALIEKYFRGLKNPEIRRPDPSNEVPDHAETLFSIETDKELQYTQIGIARKMDPRPQDTQVDYRRSIVESLFFQILNQRLGERLQEANPPYLYAGAGMGSIVRSKELVQLTSVVREGLFQEGLQTLMLEWKRLQRDGVTGSELDRAKAGTLRSFEVAYHERDKSESSTYADEYVRHLLEREAVPGIEKEYELIQQILPSIGLAEVNAVSQSMNSSENRVILFTAPEKAGLTIPTSEEILKIVELAEAAEIESYQDGATDRPLLAELPNPGSIVRKNHFEKVDVQEWILSNQVRVLLKKTDFKNDQVLLRGSSPGGFSLVEDVDYIVASSADELISQGGVGDFNSVDLGKKLADKYASASVAIGNYSEGITGFAAPQDLEVMFQLLYLRLQHPRRDEEVFQSYKTRVSDMILNRKNNPGYVFSQAVESALYGDHPRHQPVDEKWIEALDLDRSMEYYRERFSTISDFTICIVGAFDWDEMESLVTRYLASLPGSDRKEEPVFRQDDPKSGRVSVMVNKGLEDKAQIQILMHGETEWRDEDRYPLRAAVDILKIRLREVLREDEGGVYGVNAFGNIDRIPKGTFSVGISFGCKPDKAERLIELALDEVRKLKSQPASQVNIDKVKETHLRGHEASLKENSYWINNLLFRATNELSLDEIVDFPAKPESLTAEIVRAAANHYFNMDNMLIAQLHPENEKPEAQ